MKKPVISEGAFIAPDADIFGDVVIGEGSSVWFHSVIRTEDMLGNIRIGLCSNIQDNCTLHTDVDCPLVIGDDVTIGHNVVLHGCTIGDNTLIGMGAIVLNKAKIGKNCIIGAGALVTQGTEIPDGMMAFGNPAKIIRPLREDEIEHNRLNAQFYVHHAEEYWPRG